MSDSTAHGTLVTVEELQRHLDRHDWRVIDVRHDLMDTAAGRRAYAEGHIPGAVFAHIDDDLSGRKTGRNGRHPLPERADMVQAFRRWGVNDDTQIVAYFHAQRGLCAEEVSGPTELNWQRLLQAPSGGAKIAQ